jgi:hypothetical protein
MLMIHCKQSKKSIGHAQTHNVTIRQYYADNVFFAESIWMQDVQDKNQLLNFLGVGDHHQNGQTEERIRD